MPESTARRAPNRVKDPEQPSDTRERLILAAEKLFAQEEIGTVSLRRINQEAGQRNASAVHYHFGSREAIVEAILAYRMEPINGRRRLMLDELETQHHSADLRSLVGVIVWPLVEEMRTSGGDSYYVRFLARAHRTALFDIQRHLGGPHTRALVQVNRLIVAVLADIPGDLLRMRIITMLVQLIYVLADTDQMIIDHHPELRDGILDFTANNQIDMISGSLQAPVSAASAATYSHVAQLLRSSDSRLQSLFSVKGE